MSEKMQGLSITTGAPRGSFAVSQMTIREHFAALALQGLLASMDQRHDGDVASALARLKNFTLTAAGAADMLLSSLEEVKP